MLKKNIIYLKTMVKNVYNLLMQRERLATQLGVAGEGVQTVATVGILLSKQGKQIEKVVNIANTLMARDYKGFGNQATNGVLEWKK